MASSTACVPSLSGCSLGCRPSETRTGWPNQRPSGSVRWATRSGYPCRARPPTSTELNLANRLCFCEACLSKVLRRGGDVEGPERRFVRHPLRPPDAAPDLCHGAGFVRRHRIECRCFRHPQFLIPQPSNEERPRQLCPDLSQLSRLVSVRGPGLFGC